MFSFNAATDQTTDSPNSAKITAMFPGLLIVAEPLATS
jgi:hypothetical protein